jgi:hypothetical protein
MVWPVIRWIPASSTSFLMLTLSIGGWTIPARLIDFSCYAMLVGSG